jgi:hypothetical protein
MRSILKVGFGIFKIIASLLFFVSDWRIFIKFITHLGEYDSGGVLIRSTGFVLILIYVFYLIYSAWIDFRNIKITFPKLIWVGLSIGILISVMMFVYSKHFLYLCIGVATLFISSLEIVRITKEIRHPRNETV